LNTALVRQAGARGIPPLAHGATVVLAAGVKAKRKSLKDDVKRHPFAASAAARTPMLALVIARLRESNIILLDEPFAALDPKRTDLCIEEIKRSHSEGKTIIHVAHEISEFRKLADRVVTLEHGRYALAQPENRLVCGLFG
jgi:simple sugar transport system ATP-binding protein